MCQPQSSHALPTASLRSACGRPPRFPLRWRVRQQRRPSKWRARSVRSRFGFSLTELLVVIGIIVLLVGILLVALGKVKVTADKTRTESVMQQFINAATAFQAENGRFPGVIPETLLALNPQITSTENALLDLLGGFRVLTPTDLRVAGNAAFDSYEAFRLQAISTTSLAGGAPLNWATAAGDWDLVIDTRKIGEGPVINGKPHAPYFTPGAGDLAQATYSPATDNSADPTSQLPDLVDAWGQPIVYLRQLKERGPLTPDATNPTAPQFLPGGAIPYVQSTGLGELLKDQTALSILNTAADPNRTLARMLTHPAIADQAKGGICLISAGEDGVFFSRNDGPGSQSAPIDDITEPPLAPGNPLTNPKVVDDYDDVRVFGGA